MAKPFNVGGGGLREQKKLVYETRAPLTWGLAKAGDGWSRSGSSLAAMPLSLTARTEL